MSENAGKISALWRFPVKSMRGEQVNFVRVEERGLAGDRAFALLDVEQGKLVTAKNFRRFPDIFRYRARFTREPSADAALPPVVIEMPDGRTVSSDDARINEILSGSLGHQVELIGTDQRAKSAHHDASPVSLLTESTLAHLRRLQPPGDFDVRRFRMNIIVECGIAGFPENDWVDQVLGIGSDLLMQVTEPNARCVMTTLAQDELPEDRTIFSALMKHNRLERENGRAYPCAGVYARILSAGEVRVGDFISK